MQDSRRTGAERAGAPRTDAGRRARRGRRGRLAPLARGALEAGAVVAAFLAFGLGWAAAGGGAGGAPPYPPAVTPGEQVEPRVWLVDGYNVLCAGVLGVPDRQRWWAEPNRRQLLELAERFDADEAELWVVFDGDRSPEPSGPGRVHVVFAAPADDWLLAEVRGRAERSAEGVVLVTADRRLAERARRRGARVVAPRDFVRRCLGGVGA
jgi:predicted RNA-binding protein with PIN domain